MLRNKLMLTSGLVFSCSIAMPVAAKTPEEKILAPFDQCKELQDDGKRLACFDSALAVARTAVTAERDARRQRRKEDFGLSALQIESQDATIAKSDPQEATKRKSEREEIEPSTIVSVLSDVLVSRATNKQTFLLENGQLWRETSNGGLKLRPKAGQNVTISKSTLGGFKLRAQNKKGFLFVRRIR